MSNNNWKQYGGTNSNFKKFSVGNVVADDILLRQKYSGEFLIQGSISITQDMISRGIDVGQGSINRTQYIKLNNNTSNELEIYVPTKFGNNSANLSPDYFIGSSEGIGINTTDISASLHILGRPSTDTVSRNHDFIVSSGQSTSSTIITQNSSNSGIRATSSSTGSKIEFYNNSIYENLDTPGAAITFGSDGLKFDTEQFSFGDVNQKRRFRYAYDTLGDNYNAFNGTALTCKSAASELNGATSNTFLNISSGTNNGLAIAGGAFPSDTTNEAFGLFGLNQQTGNILSPFHMTYTMVSNKPTGSNDHTPIKRSRMGVNVYNPKKDYTFSVSGKMRIENGEVNEIAFINIEPIRIVYDFHSSSNYQTKYFTGSNRGIAQDVDDNNYQLVTNTNYGIGDWTLTNFSTQNNPLTEISQQNKKIAISSNVYYGDNSTSPIFRFAAFTEAFFYQNKFTSMPTFISIKKENDSGKYFRSPDGGNEAGDFSNYRYVESFLRVPDNLIIQTQESQPTNQEYLIILFQEDNGLTYMIDFGRTPGDIDSNGDEGTIFGGSRIYGENSQNRHNKNVVTGDNTIQIGRNLLYYGAVGYSGSQKAPAEILYSDISYSIVDIDALENVSINQTVDDLNNGTRGLYILGSFGFKHFKNTIATISNPNPDTSSTFPNVIASRFGESSQITNIDTSAPYFNMYICKNDRDYKVAVGENKISYTTDDGVSWNHLNAHTIPDLNGASLNLRGLEIKDDGSEIYVVGDGTILYNIDGKSNVGNANYWHIIPYDVLNANGAGEALMSSNCKLIDIHKIDQDNYLVTRLAQSFDSANNREGQLSTIHIYVPNLFNRDTNDVLDICGNVLISGDLNFEHTSKLSSSSNKITIATQTNFIIEDALGVNVSNVTPGYNVDVSGNIKQSGIVHQF